LIGNIRKTDVIQTAANEVTNAFIALLVTIIQGVANGTIFYTLANFYTARPNKRLILRQWLSNFNRLSKTSRHKNKYIKDGGFT